MRTQTKLPIKALYEDTQLPTRGSMYAAGYDLYAHHAEEREGEEWTIFPHKTLKIHTGIAIATPPGTFGAIYPRSGLSTKEGLRPANCVGVVDADYRGEVIVALHNDSNHPRVVKKGDRIAQLIISPFISCELALADELGETERGEGGFGSTGKE